MENYIVSARKYRPSTFDSVVGQKALTTTLKNAILTGKLAHAYLFCGPRGVGKTTCARIFAKTINCLNLTPEGEACNTCESCSAFNEQRSFNIHELDAASNNSVEDIRTLIDQVRIPPQMGRYKVYIIDEVHMLSQAAFNAFLKTLEEPPHHTVFILATTEKHKILPTILSRCQIYDFNRISVNDIAEHLQYVAKKENIDAEPDALTVIAQKADGAMRDALSIFDQLVSFTQGKVNYQSVIANLNVLDYEYYFRMVDYFLENKISESMLLFNDILNKGFEGNHFINGLGSHFRDLLVSRDPATISLLETGKSIRQRYQEQAEKCNPKFLYRAMKLCNDCDLNYRTSKNKRLLVEITLIQLVQLAEDDDETSNGRKPENILQPIFKKPVSTPQTSPQSSHQQSTGTKRTADYNETMPSDSGHAVRENPIPQVQTKKKIPTVTTQKLSTSIKNLPPVEPKLQVQKQSVQTVEEENRPFNEENLRHCWSEFAGQLPKEEAANAGRMKAIIPKLKDDSNFEITVDNEFVQKYMLNLKPRIEDFLRKQLHNTNICMQIRISEAKEIVKTYNKMEQFQLMSKKNPNLQRLHEIFGLELS